MTVEELIKKLETYPRGAKVSCDKAYEDGYYEVQDVTWVKSLNTEPFVHISTGLGNWDKLR